MVPWPKTRNTPRCKLQLLRSAADSHAQTSSSILADASEYIQDLQQKIKDLVEDHMKHTDMPHEVTAEIQEQSIAVRVFSKKSTPNLLLSILTAFEDLGIDVLHARVSCVEPFLLEAVGREMEGRTKGVDSEVVKEAMLQAIKNCGDAH